MKKFILASMALAAFSSCGNNHNSNTDGQLSSNIRLYNPQPATAGASGDHSVRDSSYTEAMNHVRMSRADAKKALLFLKEIFKSSYIGYEVKKSLIGKSGEEVFSDCVQNLNAYPEQISTFDYYDLVKQCIAGFQDNHLYIAPKMSADLVTSVVAGASLIAGKLYIYSVRPALIKKFETLQNLPEGSFSEKIKPGYEITSIDGQKPEVEINRIKKLIAGSSDAVRIERAVDRLFNRTGLYPLKNEVTLTIRQPDGSDFEATMPWIEVTNKKGFGGSIESRVLLSNRKILESAQLADDDKAIIATGPFSRGTLMDFGSLFSSLTMPKAYKTTADDEGDEVLLTGYAEAEGHKYCYMKLNTFSVQQTDDIYKIYEVNDNEKRGQSLIKVMGDYLTTCQTFNAKVIFDLRQNGGGDGNLAERIFYLFENKKSAPVYGASAFNIRPSNAFAFSSLMNSLKYPSPSVSADLVLNSVRGHTRIGDWVLAREDVPETEAYLGEMAVLISPNCVSACELTAHRFKVSGRAKLIGEPTSGTGFGFIGTQKYSDLYQLFSMELPNFAFQVATLPADAKLSTQPGYEGSVVKLNQIPFTENRPAVPDVTLAETYNDVFNHSVDYIKSLSRILEQN